MVRNDRAGSTPAPSTKLNSAVVQWLEHEAYTFGVAGSNPASTTNARMVKLAATSDLSSDGQEWPCGFDSRSEYKIK